MKANELMIGDWVNLKNGKVIMPCRITVIGHATQDRNEIGTTVCVDLSKEFPTCIFDMDVITPLPLTPEILEKNGFKKCAGNEWSVFKYEDDDHTKNALYQVLWSADELYLEISSYTSNTGDFNRIGIMYVHELQHALRLCGIEKTIEL